MSVKARLIEFADGTSIPARAIRYTIKMQGILRRGVYYRSQLKRGIQKNKIVYMCHHGKQYACNPMYICEYLMEHYPYEFDMVWAFKEPDEFRDLEKRGVRVVKYNSKEHIREMATAGVVVTNVDTFPYMKNRSGQMVLDTWHGGGAYKTCGFANPQNLDRLRKRIHYKNLYSKINLYMSSSKMFSEQTIRFSRGYDGEILEVGMPRNDILVNQNRPDISRKVREYVGFSPEDKIALYAPTYRSLYEQNNFVEPDFGQIQQSLEKRFGGSWKVLYRQHHFYPEKDVEILSATAYPDMQELLYTADVLITDYSSSIWDFSLMFKPVFLYCPDLDKYRSERDFYLPIEQWPFYLCHNQTELDATIEAFDRKDYEKRVEGHHALLGNCETGHATETVCKRIAEHCL